MADLYDHDYDDNDELMESLPSNSTFYEAENNAQFKQHGGVQNSGDFAPLSASEFINNSTPTQNEPTRPPPRINATGITPTSNGSTPTSGKKPFLRKGSRKEPSALHRIQGRASPITSGQNRDNINDSDFPEKPFAKGVKGGFGGSGVIEVLAPKIKSPPSKPKQPTTQTSPGSDPNETSGTFEVEWNALNAKRNEKMRQLDEFSALEQQLEGTTQLDPFAASKSQPVRNSSDSLPTSRVLQAVDGTNDDDSGDEDFGRYSNDFEDEAPLTSRAPASSSRGMASSTTMTTSTGKPPLPSTGMTVAERVKQSVVREQEEQRRLEKEARERVLLGFDEDDDVDDGEEHASASIPVTTNTWQRQPYPGEEGYPRSEEGVSDRLSRAGRALVLR